MIKYNYEVCAQGAIGINYYVFGEYDAMNIIRFQVGDTVELKKPHPCGSHAVKILRVGTQMRVACVGCGHDMTMDRVKLEKSTKRVIPTVNAGENDDR